MLDLYEYLTIYSRAAVCTTNSFPGIIANLEMLVTCIKDGMLAISSF